MGKKKKYEIIAEIQETINQIESLEETTLPKLFYISNYIRQQPYKVHFNFFSCFYYFTMA